jgi:hypothetical protein
MAADAGAQQILNLLNQPSDVLLQNLVALAQAQRKQVQKPYGVLPQYGVDALAQIRSFYRDLRAQIDAIETVDVGSKASVLEALDNLDRSFGAYERSLDFGISRPAVPKVRKADKKADEAKKGIRGAIQALSQ